MTGSWVAIRTQEEKAKGSGSRASRPEDSSGSRLADDGRSSRRADDAAPPREAAEGPSKRRRSQDSDARGMGGRYERDDRGGRNPVYLANDDPWHMDMGGPAGRETQPPPPPRESRESRFAAEHQREAPRERQLQQHPRNPSPGRRGGGEYEDPSGRPFSSRPKRDSRPPRR